ncbi:MAG: long-chain acyl-CoA synthetase, partial [Actinomycetota bacterium]|nr:long-chain acyl-CoA synthetase [Actinomycetota bacterium]
MGDDAYVLTAAEAEPRALAAAARLVRARLNPGDRIALIAPDSRSNAASAARTQAAVAALAWGALRVGIVPVMVNPVLQDRERADFVADSRVALVLADADIVALTDREAGSGGDPALAVGSGGLGSEISDVPLGRPMHFTSGTTGRSKGVWAGV